MANYHVILESCVCISETFNYKWQHINPEIAITVQ